MDAEDLTMATETFDNMVEIIEKEMLVKGSYASPIQNVDLHVQGAICDGRRYCAIGTMVVAYGVRSHEKDRFGAWQTSFKFDRMTGTMRKDYYDEALTAVHDALNDAAIQWAKDHGAEPGGEEDFGTSVLVGEINGEQFFVNMDHFSPLESLFESSPYFANTEDGRHDLLEIVTRAKEQVCGAVV